MRSRLDSVQMVMYPSVQDGASLDILEISAHKTIGSRTKKDCIISHAYQRQTYFDCVKKRVVVYKYRDIDVHRPGRYKALNRYGSTKKAHPQCW